jgi:hypothetical protein
MSPVEVPLTKLLDAKKTAKNRSANCPAHEDQRASLRISQGDRWGASTVNRSPMRQGVEPYEE